MLFLTTPLIAKADSITRQFNSQNQSWGQCLGAACLPGTESTMHYDNDLLACVANEYVQKYAAYPVATTVNVNTPCSGSETVVRSKLTNGCVLKHDESFSIDRMMKNKELKLFDTFQAYEVNKKLVPNIPNQILTIEDCSKIYCMFRLNFNNFSKINNSQYHDKIKDFCKDTFGYVLFKDQIVSILSHYANVSKKQTMELKSQMKFFLGERITFEEISQNFKSNDISSDFFRQLSLMNEYCCSRGHFLNEIIINYYLSN